MYLFSSPFCEALCTLSDMHGHTNTLQFLSIIWKKISLHTHPISTLPCAVVSIPGTPTAASLLVDTDWPVRASLTPVACQNEGSCWRSAVKVIKPTEDAWRLSTGSAQFVRQWGRRREVNNIRMRTNSSQWKFGILSFEKNVQSCQINRKFWEDSEWVNYTKD